ncbi:MAG: tRNA 2-thiouridine(34) synthase MnmA [Oscillospiraceae bacterium]|jgi:tRNA-specific 2-thiouridylase|nr:tRNA 2-thiouridine(34) synthase MnmA [Oscillospiraceae bacterium]
MKVLVGMSGGVDSSVAALILLKQGYDVTGVTMKLRPDSMMLDDSTKGCCSFDDIDDARKVAYKLSIDHIVMNFTEEFENTVIKDFVANYQDGKTPNPCIVCNQKIKFEAFLRRAISLNFDYIATGHYAVIKHDNQRCRWLLQKSKSSKDQSYVLYGMRQHQLAKTLMPLSNMEKSDVRKIAFEYDLPVANKPDSQEICFINNNYSEFIEKYSKKQSIPGDLVDKNGTVLGKHSGIINYTIGQRKGIGVSFKKPMFVTKIDAKTNKITLSGASEQYTKTLVAKNLNFILFESPKDQITVFAKLRYQAKPCRATVTPFDSESVKVEFEEPQKAVTPGQSIVFYNENLVVGGGIIQ